MATAVDPVCGMEVDPALAPAQTSYEGQAYFFCSDECRRLFEENPSEYLKSTT